MFQALLLALWATFAIYDVLGPTLIYAARPLIAGTVAGLIVGDPTLGMAIGGTLELTALGVYTYGGATIPDYPTGAIVGTALAAAAPGPFASQLAIGLTIGLPAAILLTALDPVGRFLPTFWIHAADRAAAEGDARRISLLHWSAFIPWGLTRFIPTFIAVLAGRSAVNAVYDAIPAGFVTGMTLVGGMLPAVGFAMLLKIMPVKQFWFMLPIGFVLFAYLHVPLLGIAIFGVSIAAFYMRLRPQDTSIQHGEAVNV
ncbi:MAG: PTS mannose/fructose/sorbose/N-acetylgalactosamine transporter subunit IIC [Nocardioidaceae bacterium]